MKRSIFYFIAVWLLAVLPGCTVSDLDLDPPVSYESSTLNDAVKGDKNGNSNNRNSVGFDGESFQIVTVRERHDSLYLRIEDKWDAWIENKELVKKDMGIAAADYELTGEATGSFDYKVRIRWIVPIEVNGISTQNQNQKYRPSDPVEILVGEPSPSRIYDGYLVLRYEIESSGKVPHAFYLVPRSVDGSPFDLMFLHDKQQDMDGKRVQGLVAFRLGTLPKPGEKQLLKVSYTGFDGKEISRSFAFTSAK